MPRVAMLNAGSPLRIIPLSKITAAPAPRSSDSRYSTTECPPVSSSPSQTKPHVDRQLSGPGELARGAAAGDTAAPCRPRPRGRRDTRLGSPAQTAATPTARAGRVVAHRSVRSRERWALALRQYSLGDLRSPTADHANRSARHSPPAPRMSSHTHSPACRTSAACSASALIDWMRRNSLSSSNHAAIARAYCDRLLLSARADPVRSQPVARSSHSSSVKQHDRDLTLSPALVVAVRGPDLDHLLP